MRKIKQVIYVDVLFCLNFIISFFMLRAVQSLCRERTKTVRVLLGCLLGGAYSLCIFLPEVGTAVNILSRLLFLLAVTLAVFGFGTKKRFFRLFAALSGVSLLFAGAVMAVWLVFRPNGLVIKNGSVYLDISFLTLVLFSAAVYVLVWLFGRFLSRSTNESCKCSVHIQVGQRAVSLNGVIDTGNTLTDSFTGKRISVIDRTAAFALFDADTMAIVLQGNLPEGMHLTVSDTVSGEGLLPVFSADSLSVKTPQGSVQIKDCAVAISRVDSFSNGISILVNAEFFQLLKEDRGGKENDKKADFADKTALFETAQGLGFLHKRSADLTAAAEHKAGKRNNAAH